MLFASSARSWYFVVVTSVRRALRLLPLTVVHLLHLYASLGIAFASSRTRSPTAPNFPYPVALITGVRLTVRCGGHAWSGGSRVWPLWGCGYPPDSRGGRVRRGARRSCPDRQAPAVPLCARGPPFFIWLSATGPAGPEAPDTISAVPPARPPAGPSPFAGDAVPRRLPFAPAPGPMGLVRHAGRPTAPAPRISWWPRGRHHAACARLLEDAPYEPGVTALSYRFKHPLGGTAIFTAELAALALRGASTGLPAGPRRADGSWLSHRARREPDDVGALLSLVPDVRRPGTFFVCGPSMVDSPRAPGAAPGRRRPRAIQTEEFRLGRGRPFVRSSLVRVPSVSGRDPIRRITGASAKLHRWSHLATSYQGPAYRRQAGEGSTDPPANVARRAPVTGPEMS